MYPRTGSRPLAAAFHDGSSALPAGTRLAEFEVRSVLGSGGFGIVYLAWDHALEREVALKEYLPGTLAGRGIGLSVILRSSAQADTFALGLRSFVNEARLLARFDHPSLVKVHRFWEDNGTAYMVMPYYKGRTLRHMRAGMVVPPGEGACRRVIEALLSALEVLHKEGVFHRDIAPDNILICDDGVPVLLDFGAARRVIGEGPQALTSIIKPHFAPLEQYADQGTMRQGPWTDLYALGGTAYFLVTGREPVPAASRALHDDQPRLAEERPAGCSPGFCAAIDWMLALKPPERPQSVPMLRDVLEGRITLPGRERRDRTIPGVAAREGAGRDSMSGALSGGTDFDPTGDAPRLDVASSAAPTQLMPSRSRPDGASPAASRTAPPLSAEAMTTLAGRTVPPGAHSEPAAAGAVAAGVPAQRRWLVPLLGGLLLLNALAWWWTFHVQNRPDTAPAVVQSVTAAPPPAPLASTPQAVATAAPAVVDSGGKETILSVLPARPPRPASAAAPAPAALPATATTANTAVTAAVLPRPPDAASSAPRVRAPESKPGVTAAVVLDASAGPRARCGDRIFLSMILCMKRECEAPALRNHPECVTLREQEEASRRRDSQ